MRNVNFYNLKVGDKVRLDAGLANSSIVKIIEIWSVFASVTDEIESHTWDVMLNRLFPIEFIVTYKDLTDIDEIMAQTPPVISKTSSISQRRLDQLGCVLGLDCSKYQKDIDWSKAKSAGIQFAYVKITEGATYREDKIYNVKARVLSAMKNGVKVGYYHFARPGNVARPEVDALHEVENVTNVLSLLPVVQLPLVLDLESYSTSMAWDHRISNMDIFISSFMDRLPKQQKVMLYSYRSFLDDNTTPSHGSYALWLASYVKTPEVLVPIMPNGWLSWVIWQFTERGSIDGYNGNIDLNMMKKHYFDLF